MNNAEMGVIRIHARDRSRGMALSINSVTALPLSGGLLNPFRLLLEPVLIKNCERILRRNLIGSMPKP
jgi:hypothetical protein